MHLKWVLFVFTTVCINISFMPSAVAAVPAQQNKGNDRAAVPALISGHVMPFRVLSAIRNHGYKDGMVGADINVAVIGGSREDWAATAVYLARHALVKDATFAEVTVFTASPWGEKPPQRSKSLAKAYYAPDPGKAPWDKAFDLLLASQQGTQADIEWDEITEEIADRYENIADPEIRQNRIDAEATRMIIKKYHLKPTWKPTDPFRLGIGGPLFDGNQVNIVNESEPQPSMISLLACLNSDGGYWVFQGCPYDAAAYPSALSLQK